MTLSALQISAIRQGQAVRVALPELGGDCIVIRADIYDRVCGAPDESLSAQQVGALVNAAMLEDDAQDPLLGSYQRYAP